MGVKHPAFVTTAQKGSSAEQIFSSMRPTEGVEHLLEVSYGQRLWKSAEFWNFFLLGDYFFSHYSRRQWHCTEYLSFER